MIRHPSFHALSRHADRSPDPRVDAHLRRCARCRAAVAQMHALGDAARSLPAPAVPDDALERILARRAAGERVLLAADAGAPRRVPRARRWAGAAALAAAAILAALALVPRGELQAAASELRFGPAKPAAGARVEVEYRPGSQWESADRLVLRARFRRPGDEPTDYLPARTVAVLARDGSVFRGAFVLPDSVVYAAFAVEDPAATQVDDNGNQSWELFVHGRDGRPLFAALLQKDADFRKRNWLVSLEAARRAAALYPDTLEAWSNLLFVETRALGESEGAGRRAEHRARLHAFDLRFAGRAPSENETHVMRWYAEFLRDSATETRWRERLRREWPLQSYSVYFRVQDRYLALNERPAALVAAMDTLWDEVGPRQEWQAIVGLDAAVEAGDAAAVRRWAGRYLRFRPGERSYVAGRMAELPALRGEAADALRAEAARLDTTGERTLDRTAAEQRRWNRAQRARILARIGEHLVREGHTRAGLDTLELASAEGWDPELFERIGRARLAAADSAGGLRVLARVAADPGAATARVDSLAALASSSSWGGRWGEWVREARGEMRDRVLAGALSRPVANDPVLAAGDGGSVSLRTLAGGGPAVVAFWSGGCWPAVQALPSIVEMEARLRRQGVPLLLVADTPPSDGLRRLLDRNGVRFPVYYDTRRQAAVALSNTATPTFYVLDGNGRLRFEQAPLEALPRLVEVLRMDAALARRDAPPAAAGSR